MLSCRMKAFPKGIGIKYSLYWPSGIEKLNIVNVDLEGYEWSLGLRGQRLALALLV